MTQTAPIPPTAKQMARCAADHDMTLARIKWAATHDWFCESYGDFISCWDVSNDKFGNVSKRIVYFDDYAKLRDWAGY